MGPRVYAAIRSRKIALLIEYSEGIDAQSGGGEGELEQVLRLLRTGSLTWSNTAAAFVCYMQMPPLSPSGPPLTADRQDDQGGWDSRVCKLLMNGGWRLR